MKPAIEWTDDCQGKKDYDGPIVSVSTRYWPAGGGFTLMTRDAAGVRWEENDARPEIRPAAKAAIHLNHEPEGGSWRDFTELAVERFEGDSESEVKAAVEAWVAGHFARIAAAIRREYPDAGRGDEAKGGG